MRWQNSFLGSNLIISAYCASTSGLLKGAPSPRCQGGAPAAWPEHGRETLGEGDLQSVRGIHTLAYPSPTHNVSLALFWPYPKGMAGRWVTNDRKGKHSIVLAAPLGAAYVGKDQAPCFFVNVHVIVLAFFL